MRIYILHMTDAVLLNRAFGRLMDEAEVASCGVEPAMLRLRFVASDHVGDPLVESIYQEGGLVWCSRHRFVPAPGALRAVPPPR